MPFKPGQITNIQGPKRGQRRKNNLLAELLQKEIPPSEVIERFRTFLDSDEYGLAACRDYFDRVYGKPVQAVDAALSGDITVVFRDK